MSRSGALIERDSTMIVDCGYVRSVDRVNFIEGSIEAIAALKAVGEGTALDGVRPVSPAEHEVAVAPVGVEAHDVPEDRPVADVEPFQRLIATRQLITYPYEGFWAPMDTHRDRQELESPFERGRAPWAVRADLAADPRLGPSHQRILT